MIKSICKTVLTLAAFSLSGVEAGFSVNLCLEIDNEPVANALVRCYDEDWGTDDRVGSDTYTGSNGCVSVYDNQWWWENPDIYCMIYANGQCFRDTTTSIKHDHSSSVDANFGTIGLPVDEDYCGDFGADTNGCGPASFPSWMNDAFTAVSGFASQCGAHDSCYDDCNKARSVCDDDFYDDMIAVCATSTTCEALAWIYFSAVDNEGVDACLAARTSCSSTSLCYS